MTNLNSSIWPLLLQNTFPQVKEQLQIAQAEKGKPYWTREKGMPAGSPLDPSGDWYAQYLRMMERGYTEDPKPAEPQKPDFSAFAKNRQSYFPLGVQSQQANLPIFAQGKYDPSRQQPALGMAGYLRNMR